MRSALRERLLLEKGFSPGRSQEDHLNYLRQEYVLMFVHNFETGGFKLSIGGLGTVRMYCL